MDAKPKKRLKPRLERRNAMKNIDYLIPFSSTATTVASLVDDETKTHSTSTPSHLLLSSSPPSLLQQQKTSFRVKGIDGEFDLIFRALGLSGPEDFAIPAAAWEAQKSRFLASAANKVQVQDETVTGVGLNTDIKQKNLGFEPVVEEKGHKNPNFEPVMEGNDHRRKQLNVSYDSKVLLGQNRDGGGGGIKGVRPPLLAPPPPMLLPLVDEVSSTWDLLRSFAPQDRDVALVDSIILVEEEEDERGVEEIVDGGERNLLPDSSSSTSSRDDNDDDDSDDVVGDGETEKGSVMVDELVHNVSPNGSFRRPFSSWQKGEILGKGSFGTVYEGFTDDGFFFAVKEVSLLDEGSQGKQSIFQLEQEISLLSQFEHENIVRYLGTDKDKSMLYIFLELVTKGSLASLYQKYRLRDSQVSAYTRQILSGLKYLHDRNVVHRDVKCANILVDVSGSVKLADFGLAKATKLNDVKSSKGSPYWMAPEVVNLRNRGYGLAADIWSLGCTVLEMLTRQVPYSHLEGMQALFRIGRGEPPPVPESLSKDARDFILKCLQVNPNKRPTASHLLDHPFVKRPILSPLSPASPYINHLLS